MQTARIEETIKPAKGSSIGLLTFGGGGGNTLCWAERSNSSEVSCGIYLWREGVCHKLGEHQGWITALERVEDNRLLSAGRDGRVVVWNLNGWAEHQIRLGRGKWARSASISPDGQQVAIFHEGISLLSLPQLTELSSQTDFLDFGTVPQAVFAPGGKGFVIVKKESYPRYATLQSDGKVSPSLEVLKYLSVQGKHQLPGVVASPALGLVVIGSEGSTLEFVDWPSRQLLERLYIRPEQADHTLLTGFQLSPDGSFLAAVNRDTLLTLWDLRILALRRLFSRPLAQATIAHLGAIALLRESEISEKLPPALHAALRFIEIVLAELRFRYSIELEELPSIQLGEFDIEIE